MPTSATLRGRRALPLLVAALSFLPLTGARAADPAGHVLDLKVGSAVSSLAVRLGGAGVVASFSSCKVVFLDPALHVIRQSDIPRCQNLFTVRVGQSGEGETVVASTYVGRAVLITGSHLTQYATHQAAVTDGFLVPGGLLTSSDDGSVRLLALDGGASTRTLATGVGVNRVLLPDPAATAGQPGFFAGFDTGQIQAVQGPRTRRYDSGVGRINALALSPDRHALLVAGFDGRVRSIDRATGQARDLLATGAAVNALALDSTGTRLAAVNDAGHLVVLQLGDNSRIVDAKVTDAAASAVAFGASGDTVLVGDGNGLLHEIPLPGAPLRQP